MLAVSHRGCTQTASQAQPIDSAMDSAVAASRRERSGSSDEDPLSRRDEAPTQHDSVSVSVSRQATPPPALALGAHATNQFFSLATESDEEQPPTDLRCSDADSILEHVNRRRRLRLRWDPEATRQEGCSQGCTSCAQSG